MPRKINMFEEERQHLSSKPLDKIQQMIIKKLDIYEKKIDSYLKALDPANHSQELLDKIQRTKMDMERELFYMKSALEGKEDPLSKELSKRCDKAAANTGTMEDKLRDAREAKKGRKEERAKDSREFKEGMANMQLGRGARRPVGR